MLNFAKSTFIYKFSCASDPISLSARACPWKYTSSTFGDLTNAEPTLSNRSPLIQPDPDLVFTYSPRFVYISYDLLQKHRKFRPADYYFCKLGYFLLSFDVLLLFKA